jgi:hypothetical protein
MIIETDAVTYADVIYSENYEWKGHGFIHQVNCTNDRKTTHDEYQIRVVFYEFLTQYEHEYELQVGYISAEDGSGLCIDMMRIPDYQVKALSPVMSQHNENMYRVILKQCDKGYEVHVGDDFVRIFSNYRNLPKEVKEKLGIVYGKFPNVQDDVMLQRMTVSAYINSDEEMQAIGWRVSKSWTCLVLTEKTLNSLRGETINDSRRKSESQGQEDS